MLLQAALLPVMFLSRKKCTIDYKAGGAIWRLFVKQQHAYWLVGAGCLRAKPNSSFIFDPIAKLVWPKYSLYVDAGMIVTDFPYYKLSLANMSDTETGPKC